MQTFSDLSSDCLGIKMQFSMGSSCLCFRQDLEILMILSSRQFSTIVISICCFVLTLSAGKVSDVSLALNLDSLAMMGLNIFANV